MSMTPDEIEAERERFISTRDSRRHPVRGFGDQIVDPESCGWLSRAAIAHAEKAELQEEIDRLRERVRELAKERLHRIISDDADAMFPRGSRGWWALARDERSGAWLLQLAHEAGCWFDDDGVEVDLNKWKGMVG